MYQLTYFVAVYSAAKQVGDDFSTSRDDRLQPLMSSLRPPLASNEASPPLL